jgi:hypothetical protein
MFEEQNFCYDERIIDIDKKYLNNSELMIIHSYFFQKFATLKNS